MAHILINFADEKFKAAQQFSSKTGIEIGGFDDAIEYGPSSIDKEFFEKNRKILTHPRGAGYWLWKPYIINHTLSQLAEGDILMYADSGAHFVKNAGYLTNLPKQYNQDVIPFELELPESDWTKRDAFYYMDCEGRGFEKTNQRLASFIIVRKSPFSTSFISECLQYCCDERIVSDNPNVCGLPNFPGFREHRHDQSVFSLLSKKHNLQAFRDPSQWGNPRMSEYENSSYPQIIDHTRHKIPKKKHKLVATIKRLLNLS